MHDRLTPGSERLDTRLSAHPGAAVTGNRRSMALVLSDVT
jgi:hypothetical protein